MQKIFTVLLVCILGACTVATQKANSMQISTGSVADLGWQKICDSELCTYWIELQAVDDSSVWISLSLHNLTGENALRIDTSPESYLGNGIGLRGTHKDLGHAPYQHCDSNTCYALMQLSDESISDLDTDELVTVVLSRDNSQADEIPVSFKGLRTMLDDLATKPKE